MSTRVELMTEKYLKAAEQAWTEQANAQADAERTAESSQSAPAAQANVSLHGLLSKGMPVLLLLVAGGWLCTNRAYLGALLQPGSPQRTVNALLWMDGTEYRIQETKFGSIEDQIQPFELPETLSIRTGEDLLPGLLGRQPVHDEWYKALPSEQPDATQGQIGRSQ